VRDSVTGLFEDDQVKHLGIAQDVPNAENRHIRLVGQSDRSNRSGRRARRRH
jgi:hypothetical protein